MSSAEIVTPNQAVLGRGVLSLGGRRERARACAASPVGRPDLRSERVNDFARSRPSGAPTGAETGGAH
eukprot:3308184-Prymnesium_polylepis.1